MNRFLRKIVLLWCWSLFLACLLGPIWAVMYLGPLWGLVSLPTAFLAMWRLYPRKAHTYIFWMDALLLQSWFDVFLIGIGKLTGAALLVHIGMFLGIAYALALVVALIVFFVLIPFAKAIARALHPH